MYTYMVNIRGGQYITILRSGLPYFGGTFWGHKGTSKGKRGFMCPQFVPRVPLKKIVPKRAQYGSPESRKHYIIKRN